MDERPRQKTTQTYGTSGRLGVAQQPGMENICVGQREQVVNANTD